LNENAPFESSRHPPDKPARILVLDERQAHTYMPTTHLWAGQVFGDLVQMHIAMNYLQKKLSRTLQPNMQAPDAGGFDDHAFVKVAEGRVFKPRHQKSSADGMRL
jgi:hypothetical protein